MRFVKLAVITAVVSALISCSKKGNPSPAKTGNAQITVIDGASGNSVSGATVNIYQSVNAVNSNTPEYTATSDQYLNYLILIRDGAF